MSDQPLLRVLTPHTTPEEIAALVAVLASASSDGAHPDPVRSEWANPERGVRSTAGRPLAHGRGGWRASGLPR